LTTFILSEMPATVRKGDVTDPGRVVLDLKAHGEVIATHDGEATIQSVMTFEGQKDKVIQSAWSAAREKVDESKLYQVPGEGWYRKSPPKQETGRAT
jgi:hypothetical protein